MANEYRDLVLDEPTHVPGSSLTQIMWMFGGDTGDCGRMTAVAAETPSRIRGVVSDLDGVLRSFDQGLQERIDIDHGLEPGTIARVAFADDLLVPAITGAVSDPEWRTNVAGALAHSVGEARARSAVDAWSASPGRIDTEVLDLIRRVRRKVPVVVLTNATSRLCEDLQRLGFLGEVDAVVSSAATGHAKPDRRAFGAARQAMRLVVGEINPAELLFVDDDQRHVDAAADLGWAAVRFRDPRSLARDLTRCGLLRRR